MLSPLTPPHRAGGRGPGESSSDGSSQSDRAGGWGDNRPPTTRRPSPRGRRPPTNKTNSVVSVQRKIVQDIAEKTKLNTTGKSSDSK